MSTLYLHIGTPKTGTTAIQDFCVSNRKALEAKGYCYPETPRDACNSYTIHNGHFLIQVPQREDGSFLCPEDEAAWRAGIRSVAEMFRKFPNVILSDEIIWHADFWACQGMWRNLKAASEANGFQVKVVVYLRRQDLYMSSAWAQRVKSDTTEIAKMKWEDALDLALTPGEEWSVFDYHCLLEKIAGNFGREAVIARVYDRNRFVDGNIVPDFLDAIGLRMDPGVAISNCELNPSIHGNLLQIQRIVNEIPGYDGDVRYALQRAMQECRALEQDQPATSIYSEGDRDAILKRYEESNRLLARDYFGDESAPLFGSLEPLPPQWKFDGMSMCESIIHYFGMIVCQQQREIEELKSKFYLRRKLRRLWKTLPQRLKLSRKRSNDK